MARPGLPTSKLGPAPKASNHVARRTMEANRSRDTRPEILLRSALHRRGLRFRKNALVKTADLSVRVDVLFPRQHVAVFVDGCFWHGCPLHLAWPKANAAWWQAKIEGNQARDRRVDAGLTGTGWSVVRVWEHEAPEHAADTIHRIVNSSAGADGPAHPSS